MRNIAPVIKLAESDFFEWITLKNWNIFFWKVIFHFCTWPACAGNLSALFLQHNLALFNRDGSSLWLDSSGSTRRRVKPDPGSTRPTRELKIGRLEVTRPSPILTRWLEIPCKIRQKCEKNLNFFFKSIIMHTYLLSKSNMHFQKFKVGS